MKIRLFIMAIIFSCIASAQKREDTIAGNVLGVDNPLIVTPVSGTMIANTTYTVIGDIEVLLGDTLFLPSGVTVCVENDACIIVKGVLISLGTQANPNWFTVCGRPKTDNIGQPETTDSAWGGGNQQGLWPGIECDTSCTLLVLKWTHVEFAGAGASASVPCYLVTSGSTNTNYAVLFQNLNGNLIMEDSWIYGTQNDAVRVEEGHFDIMRNTFEKTGYQAGDCNNMKSGTVGDCAYNLYMGCAINGSKASNKGGETIEDDFNMYNNTYISCGYRGQYTANVGADIDYEQGAEGSAYNNLIVDCRVGFRIVGVPAADTAHCYYGNNYIYGDSISLTTQFYPVDYITKPDAYVIPNPAITGYVYNPSTGAAQPTGTELADDSALISLNNPLFVNFPLPENPTNFPGMQAFSDINNDNCEHNYNFNLQAASPALGIGNTNASYMLNACASITNPNWGPNESVPCVDIGCYPSTYTGGNHHNCSVVEGIEKVNNNISILVYPNPNSGQFTLEVTSGVTNAKNGTIEIYNMLACKIYTSKINSEKTTINLPDKSAGIFLCRVLDRNGNLLSTGKFIIQ